MSYETIAYTKKDDVATIILNRPDVHNAMNETMMKEITGCVQDIQTDDTIALLILTGNGPSFCAGADLSWMKRMVNYSKEENEKDSRLLLDMYDAIYSCPKPVLGRINGHAFGGGIGLLAVCDLTIGVPEAKFAFSEVKLGIIPSVISSFISSRMSLADMRRFFITGERFTAALAHEIGLLDIIVPVEMLDATVDSYIEQLCSSAPQAIKEVKMLLNNLATMELKQYKQHTVEKIAQLRISAEGQEGINAFLQKRKQSWRH